MFDSITLFLCMGDFLKIYLLVVRLGIVWTWTVVIGICAEVGAYIINFEQNMQLNFSRSEHPR